MPDRDDTPAHIRREMARNWHRHVTQWWGEVTPVRGSTDEMVVALLADKQLEPYLLRRLALDLMVASFPEGQPPPHELVALMKRALELPDDHEPGQWPFTDTRDRRETPGRNT